MVRTDAQPEIIPHLGPHAPELMNAPYALAAAAVAQVQGVNPATGLSRDEAARRLAQFGANAIQQIRPRAAWRLLLDQFASLIIGLLAVAALVAFLTSDVVEGLAIVVVLMLNALIGFAMEWQAGRALDALRRAAHTTARVRRAGRETMLDALALVPGDVVVLAAAGSTDVRAVADCIETARRLGAVLDRPVSVGFISAALPRLADEIATARAAHRGRRVVVSSYLLAPGYFAGLAAQAGGDVTAPPLLMPDAPAPAELVEIVLDRYAAARP